VVGIHAFAQATPSDPSSCPALRRRRVSWQERGENGMGLVGRG